MPNVRKPRKGSMQFWPRKRAKRPYPRVGAWASSQEAKPLGFAGYKAGMAHIVVTDNGKNSMTKGQDITMPVTIVECPPLKIASFKFYRRTPYGKMISNEITTKADKELGKKVPAPKKAKDAKESLDKINPDDYSDMTLLVYTQPKATGIGKKRPEIFEIGIGGDMKAKLEFAKSMLGKEINVADVFQEGEQIDIHAITKGKGNQGPVKRFGIGIRARKSEKTKRGPGSLGGWCAQGHVMYRVAHAGQMGYQARVDYNKHVIKIETDTKKITPKGGFSRYGVVRNPCLLIKGSLPGAAKRLVRLCKATRANYKISKEAPAIQEIILK